MLKTWHYILCYLVLFLFVLTMWAIFIFMMVKIIKWAW